MSRLRVAHVITRLCRGGAQENTFQTVLRANVDRFEVDLIAGPPLGPEGSMEDRIGEHGVSIVRVPELRREPSPGRDVRALLHLCRLFRRNRYDIVHTHTSKAGFIGRLAAKLAGTPIVVHTGHGNIFDGYHDSLVTRFFVQLERWAAGWTEAMIELTPRGIEEHLAQGIGNRDQYRVIHSGIDTNVFVRARERRKEAREARGIGEDALVVGGLGRLEPVKGFEYFLEAAPLIRDAIPNAVFLLAGDGSERERLEATVDVCRFLGHVSDSPSFLSAIDMLVVPSLNEGMGRVVIEAAAAGVPVVASHVGGLPDVVRDGETGILVPPRDARAIAEAVVSLLGDPERRERMGAAAAEFAVPAYDIRTMVAEIEALYEELWDARSTNRR